MTNWRFIELIPCTLHRQISPIALAIKMCISRAPRQCSPPERSPADGEKGAAESDGSTVNRLHWSVCPGARALSFLSLRSSRSRFFCLFDGFPRFPCLLCPPPAPRLGFFSLHSPPALGIPLFSIARLSAKASSLPRGGCGIDTRRFLAFYCPLARSVFLREIERSIDGYLLALPMVLRGVCEYCGGQCASKGVCLSRK